MKERARGGQSSVDERYMQWKSLVPFLYDWLANHNLVWPSLSCRYYGRCAAQFRPADQFAVHYRSCTNVERWGPQLEQATYKNRQRLYLSEQTDGSVPNTLVIANCEVVKPRVAAAEHISQFNEEARSPFVKKFKTIIHSGEVLIWDVETQPNRHAVLGASDSHPDLILTGHTENAEFALAMSPTEPIVISGGKDKSVVLWSIQDHITAAAVDSSSAKQGTPSGSAKQATKSSGQSDKDSPSIGSRGIYKGHTDTVEDVTFCPSNSQEFCSVGDDSCLILWDARVSLDPAIKVEKAHDGDIHCVDWNPHDVNLILTGSADNSVRLFDRRTLSSAGLGTPVHTFEGHNTAVLCVQWCPDKPSVFGSSAEDGFLNVWDHEKVGQKKEHLGKKVPNSPQGLFFQHAGHRDKVVDFHWNAFDSWTIVSVSDDGESTGGGGTLQIWRMSDLIYRPEEEVLAELEKYKYHIFSCSPKS